MPLEQAVSEYKNFVAKGFHEVVLTGIHLGQYGRDLDISLYDLLLELLKVEGDCRIRLGSLEPKDLSEDLLNLTVGNPRFCQHLHIPLQSGSDSVLKSMRRNYDLAYFADLVERVRSKNHLIAIGTDLIVGFPGETDTDFTVTCNFIKEQKFSRIHVFRFSPRSGTPTAEMPEKVTKAIQEERSRVVKQIATESAQQFAKQFIDRSVEALFEERTFDGWSGLSGEYLRVIATSELDLKNTLQTIQINRLKNDQLIGSLIL
jgi:threonylcarbamoyladenosine tRNA methylthiotransferase MtaB